VRLETNYAIDRRNFLPVIDILFFQKANTGLTVFIPEGRCAIKILQVGIVE
jgi:hypothetical protein